MRHGTWTETGGGGPSGGALIVVAAVVVLAASGGAAAKFGHQVLATAGEVVIALVWAAGALVVTGLAAGAVFVWRAGRRYNDPERYRAQISPPGRVAAMLAEREELGERQVTPAEIAAPAQHFHLDLHEGVSPATATAAVRAMKEGAAPLPPPEDWR